MRTLAILILFLCSRAEADSGKAGADFLRIMPSPRAVGMGEAGTGLSDDHLSALSLNPAGLARLRYPEASFVYSQWVEGISLQNLAYAHPTKTLGAFSLSGTLLQVSPVQAFDNSGGSAGAVKVQDLAIRTAYAKRVFGPPRDERYGLFAGAGLKYVREQLETVSASAFWFDGGLLYARSLGAGAGGIGGSVESLGRGLRFDAERDPPPTVARLGLSYSRKVLDDPLTLVWDLRKPSEEGLSFGLGAEYSMRRTVFWRIGWTSESDLGNGMRFGVGFRIKIFSLDYALAQFGDFGFTHRIALSTRFGEPATLLMPVETQDEQIRWHIQKGDNLAQEKRYPEAALEYQEALRLDPHDKRTLEKMRRLLDLMERGE